MPENVKKETRLIAALDTESLAEAERIVRLLSPAVRYFKIGSQLFTAAGPPAVEMVRAHKAEVFLDLKFHDIPNTAAGAALSAMKLGVWMFNVHALGGREMLTALVRRVREEAPPGVKTPLILGVTVLTSMDRRQLNSLGIMRSVKNQVVHLAKLCRECGLDGVVCSGRETEILRRVLGRDFVLVVPGVRAQDGKLDDQKRVITPFMAARSGADYVVAGRPVIAAPEPLKAAQEIIRQLQAANG